MAEYYWSWEPDAQAEREMPDGLPLADQMAYTTMRNIYAAHHRKQLPREVAVAEKQKVIRAYEQAKEAEAFQNRLAQYQARQRKAAEAAATACRKDPTPENAIRLCNVLDGLERPA